jgi:outer membrane protein OmpA-like peptidoglycan-associated protein
LIPDFLEGNYVKSSWFAPNASPEMQAEKAAYFGPGGVGSPPGTSEKLKKVSAELKKNGIEKIAVVGYCCKCSRYETTA